MGRALPAHDLFRFVKHKSFQIFAKNILQNKIILLILNHEIDIRPSQHEIEKIGNCDAAKGYHL